MGRTRITALAAALAAAAALTGGTAAQASIRPAITGYGYGSGSTATAAKQAAVLDLHGNYGGCDPYALLYDNQLPNGTWSAEVTASCKTVN